MTHYIFDTIQIFAWDYDIKRNKLYHSTENTSHQGPVADLWVYDRVTKIDSVLFEYPKNYICPNLPGVKINKILFSGNYEKMEFSLSYLTLSSTDILTYWPDSNKITIVTHPCIHYGQKSLFAWANDDTLVYCDLTQYQISGISVPHITSINNNKEIALPKDYSLSNYPNPFNGGTIIEYNIPVHETGELQIFNILGKKIKSFTAGELKPGKNKISWNGKDSFGNVVSSGVYFALIKLNKSSIQIKPLKLIYIK